MCRKSNILFSNNLFYLQLKNEYSVHVLTISDVISCMYEYFRNIQMFLDLSLLI